LQHDGSNERDDAIILQTLSLLKKQNLALQKAISISKNLSSNKWLSTQTTAYCLLAMANYVGNANEGDKTMSFDLVINGVKQSIKTKTSISQNTIRFSNKNSVKLSLKNTSQKRLFVRVVNKGQPITNNVSDAESNLDMQVAFKDLKGNNLSPVNITQGTDFVCEVKVSNHSGLGNYSQMALSTIFPSGWQIHNTRLFGENPLFNSSNSDYQDIKDDRVYTYFNINNNQTLTYYFILNASYLGRFYLPPIVCEAMYNSGISARKKGVWVNVVSKQKPNS
jgi:uncharacterized protein YfaS (alpha-2-macroglobulin family)